MVEEYRKYRDAIALLGERDRAEQRSYARGRAAAGAAAGAEGRA